MVKKMVCKVLIIENYLSKFIYNVIYELIILINLYSDS